MLKCSYIAVMSLRCSQLTEPTSSSQCSRNLTLHFPGAPVMQTHRFWAGQYSKSLSPS